MSKVHKQAGDQMRAEYDFSGAVRGKYLERYKESSNIVALDADVSLLSRTLQRSTKH